MYHRVDCRVTKLYKNIKDNGYQLAFLSARSIGLSDRTRSYLSTLSQARAQERVAGLERCLSQPPLCNCGLLASLVYCRVPAVVACVAQEGTTLVEGPVILAPDGITTALVREVIR